MIPPVSRYMTSSPHAVAPNETLSSAGDLMRHYKVGHMPVLDDHALVGILSERDVLSSYAVDDTVADAMNSDVSTVFAEMPIDDVVALMRARHIGAVIIAGPAGVEGIFTLADVTRAFCDLIRPERSPAVEITPGKALREHVSDTD